MRNHRLLGLLASRGFVPEIDLMIEVDHLDAAIAVLRPIGRIDLATSPLLRRVLKEAVAESGDIRIDLSGVRMVHSSGLAVLVEGLHVARSNGTRFALLGVTDSLRRLLELSRLDTLLPIDLVSTTRSRGDPVDRPLAMAA